MDPRDPFTSIGLEKTAGIALATDNKIARNSECGTRYCRVGYRHDEAGVTDLLKKPVSTSVCPDTRGLGIACLGRLEMDPTRTHGEERKRHIVERSEATLRPVSKPSSYIIEWAARRKGFMGEIDIEKLVGKKGKTRELAGIE
jgi:hypothetical protein